MSDTWLAEHVDGLHVVTNGTCVVATCERQQDAEQIAREHNAHEVMRAALEAVVGNLDYLRNQWGDEGITRTVRDKVQAALDRLA
jgi:N-acetylglutamate synthase/N-acetylornithine aminotransferase